MKMTIRDFMCLCDRNNYDVDITSDYTDEMVVNYVGGDFYLTNEGKQKFEKILDLYIDFDEPFDNAVVIIPDGTEEDMDECEKNVRFFFKAIAGYCSVTNWGKWFSTTPEDEYEEDEYETESSNGSSKKIEMRISELIEKLQSVQSQWGDIEVLCDTQDGSQYTPCDFEVNQWRDLKTNEKIPRLMIS